MSIILRAMRQIDVSQVYAIEKAISIEPWSERLFSDCISVGYSCWVLDELDDPDPELGFSNYSNKVIGYGLLSCAANEAHVLNIAIKPDKQRSGLGKKMMQHLVQQARIAQAEIIYLEVRKTNFPAINLYKQLAFVEVGNRKGYYAKGEEREDAIVLALGL